MKPVAAATLAFALAATVSAPGLAQDTATDARFCTELGAALTTEVDAAECLAFLSESGFVVSAPSEAVDGDASSDEGAWVVGDIEEDPMTDASTAIAYLEAESGANDFGTPVALIVRCSNGETDIIINWNDYFGSDGTVKVDTRVDDGTVTSQGWYPSTDDDATFYPKDAVTFIQSLFDKTEVVFRATPYNSGPVTAVFALEGIEDAMRNVREACNWP